MTRALVLGLCLLLAAPSLAAPPHAKRKKKRRPHYAHVHHRAGACWFEMPIAAAFSGEAAQGQGLAQVDLQAARVEASVAPTLRCLAGRLQLRSALRLWERGGTALDERGVQGRFGLAGRPGRGWDLALSGHVLALDRPAWPDPYQPVLGAGGEPTGALLGSKRWGGLWAGLDVDATVRLPHRLTLALSLDWTRRWDAQDAAFDAALRPDHLTPRDGDTTRAAVALRAKRGRWRLDAEAALRSRRYRYVFARDAVTGATHASPGGAGPNPLLETLGGSALFRAWVSLPYAGLRLESGLELGGDADLFQGYESAWLVGGRLVVSLRPLQALHASARYDVAYRLYTEDGYGETAAGAGSPHPALDDGASVRQRLTHRLRLAMRYRVWRRLEPFVEASLLWSDTNFPDYVPYEHPPHSPYDVDFDTTRWELAFGVRISI